MKKGKLWNLIKHIVRNIKLREQLLLVYIVCGMIPLIAVSIYFSSRSNNILIQQSEQSENVELTLIKDSLSEDFRVVADVSKKMYFNDDIEYIASHEYNSNREILEDYRKFTKFQEYLTDYYQEISSITMYLDNKTIANSGSFIYADQNIRTSQWYQDTIEQDGMPVFSCSYNNVLMKKSIRLSRVIKTKEGEKVGVLSIVMQNKRTEIPISERNTPTAILLNDQEFIHSTGEDMNEEQVTDLLAKINKEEDSGYKKVRYNDEECIFTYERIHPTYSASYFTIVSIRPYSDILKESYISNKNGFIFVICFVTFSLVLIIVFSHKFSFRVNRLKREMHKAATGDFEIITEEDYGDEIAELYQDLHKMTASIKELMSTVVEEQVQKEKLYSRQKDVEFKMLASQINPHFLYNTLETIRMKARVNHQSDIEELVKMLAKMMRRNIQVGERLVTVSSEIELVEYYLKIQHYRFGDRIQYKIEVEEEVKNIQIVPLLIQPIVENAFVHGLESKEGEGVLEIYVQKQGNNLEINVLDNGVGIHEDKLKEIYKSMNDLDEIDRSHIGLSNVNQRIKLLYGKEYGVTIKTEVNMGTTVLIRLPLAGE